MKRKFLNHFRYPPFVTSARPVQAERRRRNPKKSFNNLLRRKPFAWLQLVFPKSVSQSELAPIIWSANSAGRVNMTSWLPSISSSLNAPSRDDIRG